MSVKEARASFLNTEALPGHKCAHTTVKHARTDGSVHAARLSDAQVTWVTVHACDYDLLVLSFHVDFPFKLYV